MTDKKKYYLLGLTGEIISLNINHDSKPRMLYINSYTGEIFTNKKALLKSNKPSKKPWNVFRTNYLQFSNDKRKIVQHNAKKIKVLIMY